MKYYSLLFAIVAMLCSCNSEEEFCEITMADGNIINVDSTRKYYSTEEEFVHSVSFSFPRQYNVTSCEQIEYSNYQEYTVYGYDQFFIGCWEKAEFGDWITQYGLIPHTTYYVSTIIYVKYISETPKGLRIVPKFGGEYMGYCPDIIPNTFRVYQDSNEKYNVLTTGIRHVGYDLNRNSVKVSLPSFIDNNKNKLTWNFLIRDDGWE